MKHEHQENLGMVTMMMAMCLSVVLLVAVIPSIGWPLGIVIGLLAGAAMLFLHGRYMGHGKH